VIKMSRFRWFECVEHKDDVDSVKQCTMIEIGELDGVHTDGGIYFE